MIHLFSPSQRAATAGIAELAALLLLASLCSAQTVPPITAVASEESVQLSPFVVSSTKDTGYQATTTLAGTRLNTPVKDLGAAISIYTQDFLEDIGATNSSELLVFATGMEAAGPGGNFSGATADINDTAVVGEEPRGNPQASSRSRGLAAPNFSRSFFTTDISFDTYNTGGVTVNRGPNAVLFGVGSPSGVVDTALNLPDLRRNKNRVEMRYGSNDSLRGSVDFNRVLVDRKLALRIAALHDSEQYNQRPAFEEKKRIYGAVTFAPFESTSLRANFESGHTRANRPITVLPFNSVSDAWLAQGRQGYDWSFYDDPVRNRNAATQIAGDAFEGPLIAQRNINDQVVVVYANPSDRTPAYAFRSRTPNASTNAANTVKDQVFNPLVNRDLAADTIRFNTTQNIFELGGNYWTGANVLPGQLSNLPPAGIKMQGFTDFSAFDFKDRQIDETSRQGDSFHAFNIAFEQRAWADRVGIELAYDTQRVDRHSKNAFFSASNANHIRIDPNVTLPTGQPNPNVGRPYVVAGQSTWSNKFSSREAMRATAYLKYDFKDLSGGWGKWLGRHTLTGLYEENGVDMINYMHRLAADGVAARAINPNINVLARRAQQVVYIGPSVVGNNNPIQLQPIQISELNAGPLEVPASYFVRAANATDPGAFVDVPTTLVEINGGGNAQREVIKSQAAVLQSYWLKDHLITLFGWRRDEDYFASQSINFVANPADSNDPGKVHYGFNDLSFPRTPPPNVTKEIKSYSAVLRWPQRLFKLPADADLSGFYNQSENFTPIGGRVNGFGEPQASPQGKTKEFGFNLSAFDGKISLRVNRFETKVQGQSYSPAVYSSTITNAILQTTGIWALEANANPHLAAMANRDIELIYSVLPANFRQLYDWRVIGTAPNLSRSNSNLPGSGDTTDFTAKGMEVELVYNPTSNWRIMTNVAKQESVQSNSMPFLKQLISRLLPVWNQLRNRPQSTYPTGWQVGDPTPPNSYGTYLDSLVLVPFATALATEGSASAEQRKWRANLVTRYAFGRGSIFGEKLKGWSIGGAVRWQDRLGIGYPTRRNPDESVTLDLKHPFYAPPETNVDAFVSYERKLWSNRINWKVQFNVRNLYGDSTTIPVGVQPWGAPSTVRLAPERRWYLNNTFSF